MAKIDVSHPEVQAAALQIAADWVNRCTYPADFLKGEQSAETIQLVARSTAIYARMLLEYAERQVPAPDRR